MVEINVTAFLVLSLHLEFIHPYGSGVSLMLTPSASSFFFSPHVLLMLTHSSCFFFLLLTTPLFSSTLCKV
jgi:hypothetical protein